MMKKRDEYARRAPSARGGEAECAMAQSSTAKTKTPSCSDAAKMKREYALCRHVAQ